MVISVDDKYYSFRADFNKKFGEGRYKGCSLGNWTDAGWYWGLDSDYEIMIWFGHIAYSRANRKKLEDMIDDKSFKLIKDDILKSGIAGLVQIILGWRDLDHLRDYIDDSIEDEIYEKKLDSNSDEAEKIRDRLWSNIDVEEIFTDIVANSENDIIKELKKANSVSDLLRIIHNDIYDIVWHFVPDAVLSRFF